jgi:feruloyl esterase
VSSIAAWVEKGTPPDRILAKKYGRDAAVLRSRPVCPYPQHAVYKGSGNTDFEANFVCR